MHKHTHTHTHTHTVALQTGIYQPMLLALLQPSIATATNIDTLLAGQGKEEISVPPESMQDKVFFIFNNLSLANMTQKVSPPPSGIFGFFSLRGCCSASLAGAATSIIFVATKVSLQQAYFSRDKHDACGGSRQ